MAKTGIDCAKRARCTQLGKPRLCAHGWTRALGRVPGGYKVGTDGLSAEMLRAMPWEAKRRLSELLDDVEPETYQQNWTEVELVTIAKEASQAPSADQLRYLGLGAFGGKLFTTGLLQTLPQLPPEHVGYRAGGRTGTWSD